MKYLNKKFSVYFTGNKKYTRNYDKIFKKNNNGDTKTVLMDFLKSKGWHQWYNKNYWVKKDLVDDELDYTQYGFCLEEAVKIEKLNKNKEKIKNKFGIVELNIIDFLIRIRRKNEKNKRNSN